ncbi:RNA-directed DNA polymerase, eukaryota, reverse transcriptase zinc-binding domain protein [Tanacetum coccineum]
MWCQRMPQQLWCRSVFGTVLHFADVPKERQKNETCNVNNLKDKGKENVMNTEMKSANKYVVLSKEMNMEEYEKTVCHDERLAMDWYAVNRGDGDSDDEEDIIENNMNENECLIADEIVDGYLFMRFALLDTVKKEWDLNIQGSHMYKLVKNLKILKKPLNRLSWSNGNVFDKVKVLKENPKNIQGNIGKNPHDESFKKEVVDILNEYTKAVKDEFVLLKQKAKVKWIKDGDKNTAYFHGILKARRTKIQWKVSVMKGVIDLRVIMLNTLSNNEAVEMVKDISDDEIKEALFDIDVKEFFRSGKLLGEINATLIALIPKMSTPKKYLSSNQLHAAMSCISYNGQMDYAVYYFIKVLYLLEWGYSWIFQGGIGLRQGDPISPYLFTLVMEVFNLIMMKNITGSSEFGYHFGCKELKLSHICFADDLLVLCKGNKESLQVIKQTLEEFNQVLGLSANLGKSIISFGSIKEEYKQELLQILSFKYGKLLVR